MSITSQISSMESELHQLRVQNESLTNSCAMLEEALQRTQSDLLIMTHERDEAKRAVSEVQTLIEGIGKMAIDGITKIRASKSMIQRPAPQGNTAALLASPEYK